MRIGVLGGTFDPPHLGHFQLAKTALEELQLDLVIWVPNRQNPFQDKKQAQVTPEQRMQMVALAIADEPKMAVSDIEVQRRGISYMFETLDELHLSMPGDYWLLMGADAVSRFFEWRHPDRILRTTRLAVALRPGTDRDLWLSKQGELVQNRVDLIEMAPLPFSSTDIRLKLAKGKDVTESLCPRVAQYINENGLYSAE